MNAKEAHILDLLTNKETNAFTFVQLINLLTICESGVSENCLSFVINNLDKFYREVIISQMLVSEHPSEYLFEAPSLFVFFVLTMIMDDCALPKLFVFTYSKQTLQWDFQGFGSQ
ncbi:unnamed protein product [Orchesella dallaii]|uniref:Uncharacterized protein n=1 Tax=Orchesella dallaii TaxID=48710 RepID=A0ABP1RTS3_9HEXA